MAGILLGENATDEERAAYARELSRRNQEDAVRRLAEMKARLAGTKLAAAELVGGAVLRDEVVPAGGYWTGEIRAGDVLRIVDLEGRQAVDFMCYDLTDRENRYNAANTIKFNRSIFVGTGARLYSDRADVLMTVREDTVGFHDTIGGCCSSESNRLRYGIPDTPSCRTNFLSALAEHGMSSRDLPANLNFFMYVPVREDGSTEILEGMSEPGDYVDLEARRDVLAMISNCPQIYNPCNAWLPTPIRLVVWQPAA